MPIELWFSRKLRADLGRTLMLQGTDTAQMMRIISNSGKYMAHTTVSVSGRSR
jgi:hypothetical protein